jgi:hypothetical protein
MVFSILKNQTIKFWITWLFTMIVGWATIQYAGIGLQNLSFYTWNEVFSVLWQFVIKGALIGVLLGLLCSFIFRGWTNSASLWGLSTFLGYAIGNPLGFFLAVAFSWLLARLNGIELLADSSYFLSMPLILTMIFSGFLVALCQLPALQRTFPITWREKTLWLLGSSMSWGVGFIVANVAWGMQYPPLVQSLLVGLVISVFTAGILHVLLATKPQAEAV